jgi:GntR family transcriptional regulator/MocR family aminotransferase
VTLFPLARWLAARSTPPPREHRERSTTASRAASATLREALADHLGRTRGVIAEPEQIVVVQGTAQGVWLLLHVLSQRGASRIAVEDRRTRRSTSAFARSASSSCRSPSTATAWS